MNNRTDCLYFRLCLMFYFKFAEETKYFKNVATNIVQFDNGPQIISHPPPSMSLGDDLKLGVSWTCEAVANGPVMYTWLRDKKVLKCHMTKFSEILSLHRRFPSAILVCDFFSAND